MFTTLTRKVQLSAGILLVLLALAGTWGLETVQTVQQRVEELTDHSLDEILANEAYARAIRRAIAEGQNYGRTADAEEQQEARAALDDAARQLDLLEAQGEGDRFDPALFDAHMSAYAQRHAFLGATTQHVAALEAAVAAGDAGALADTLEALEQADADFDTLEAAVAAEVARDVDATLASATAAIGTIRLTYLLGVVGLAGFLVLAVVLLYIVIVRPVTQLSASATAMAAGGHLTDVAVTRRDELGVLQRALNALLVTIRENTHRLEQEVVAAQAARREAEQAHAVVQAQLGTIATQQSVIREMSVPVLPVTPTTFVMPLVGALDSTRLGHLQAQALTSLEQASARYLILDVTGVPVIDTAVGQGLLQVVQAARLLGAEVILAGIRPEVAQTIVMLGIDLRAVVTQPSLQSAIAHVSFAERRN